MRGTREIDFVAMGASVRGSLALERAARAWALLHGRNYVIPQDVERLFIPVVFHRLVFAPGFRAGARGQAVEEVRRRCFERAPSPGSDDDPLFRRPGPLGSRGRA